MKLKTLFLVPLLLLLPGFAVLLQSCKCRDFIWYCHSTTGISAKVMDNSFAEPQPISNGAVLAKALVVQLNLEGHIEVCSREARTSAFAMSAYANQIICDDNRYLNHVEAIEITSSHDFDDAYKAGDNLTPLFVLPDTSNLKGTGIRNCYLMHDPRDTGTHTFTVTLKYRDGRLMTASTESVKLLK